MLFPWLPVVKSTHHFMKMDNWRRKLSNQDKNAVYSFPVLLQQIATNEVVKTGWVYPLMVLEVRSLEGILPGQREEVSRAGSLRSISSLPPPASRGCLAFPGSWRHRFSPLRLYVISSLWSLIPCGSTGSAWIMQNNLPSQVKTYSHLQKSFCIKGDIHKFQGLGRG